MRACRAPRWVTSVRTPATHDHLVLNRRNVAARQQFVGLPYSVAANTSSLVAGGHRDRIVGDLRHHHGGDGANAGAWCAGHRNGHQAGAEGRGRRNGQPRSTARSCCSARSRTWTHTRAPHSGQPRATRTRRRSGLADAGRVDHQAVARHPEAVRPDVDRSPPAGRRRVAAASRGRSRPGARSRVVHASGVPAGSACSLSRVPNAFLRRGARPFFTMSGVL